MLVTLSPRQLNTPFEVRNIPHFSSRDPLYVPSRSAFLRRTATPMFLSYMVVDLGLSAARPEENAVRYALTKVPLLQCPSEVSTEEMFIKTLTSFASWLNMYCSMRIGHGPKACLAVGSGISQVSA